MTSSRLEVVKHDATERMYNCTLKMKTPVSEHCGADRNSQREHGSWRGQEILRNILSLYLTDGFPKNINFGFPEN